MLVREFPSAKVVAVGKSAERLLNEMGVVLAATVRHPANGGATAFKQELERLVSG
jgi:uracil-DNA glycosylase